MSSDLIHRLEAAEQLETESDLHLAGRNIRAALTLMKECNRERAEALGLPRGTCPNVLRDKAHASLRAQSAHKETNNVE